MWQRVDTARRNVALYRDRLVPLARAAAEATRQGLVTGKNSLFELIMAQRALIEAETNLVIGTVEYHHSAEMLATVVMGEDHL
jgi:outer membrane protein TolC